MDGGQGGASASSSTPLHEIQVPVPGAKEGDTGKADLATGLFTILRTLTSHSALSVLLQEKLRRAEARNTAQVCDTPE